MPIEMRTHGLDWKRRVRETDCFVALVTPAWLGDRLPRRQLAYARALGKPVTLLIQRGTPVPMDIREEAQCFVWDTIADLATLVAEIEQGQR